MTGKIIAFFRYLVFQERGSYHMDDSVKRRVRENILRKEKEDKTVMTAEKDADRADGGGT